MTRAASQSKSFWENSAMINENPTCDIKSQVIIGFCDVSCLIKRGMILALVSIKKNYTRKL